MCCFRVHEHIRCPSLTCSRKGNFALLFLKYYRFNIELLVWLNLFVLLNGLY